MLRAAIIVVAASFALLARAAFAEDTKCAGTIIKIDGDTVTVKGLMQEGQQHQMKIEPATQITSVGKPVMATDLKVGQKVKCVCERKDGTMICTSMEIMRDTP